MNRTPVAAATFLSLIVARAADLVVTLHLNPSLDREANPIVRCFGGGVWSLIIASATLIAILSAGLFLFVRDRSVVISRILRISFSRFVFLWGREVIGSRDSFAKWMPGGERWSHSVQALRLFSLALSWAIIWGSVAAVGAWVAFLEDSGSLQAFFAGLLVNSVPGTPYVMAFLGFLFGVILFFIAEWRAAIAETDLPPAASKGAPRDEP